MGHRLIDDSGGIQGVCVCVRFFFFFIHFVNEVCGLLYVTLISRIEVLERKLYAVKEAELKEKKKDLLLSFLKRH